MSDWNDVIQRMSKNNSLKSLLGKLRIMLQNDEICAVIMYNPISTASLRIFDSIELIEKYIDNTIIDMIYIKTKFGEWDVYLDKYDTYRFENRKGYKLLKIMRFDKEINIKI